MTLRLLLAALIVQFAGIAPAQVDFSFEKKADDHPVKPSLVADITARAPGKPFTAGVRFEIADEWDIYWQFGGDLGLPTRVDWELPPGFQAGPLQWPLPEAYLAAGDIMNYVYHHEVMLMAEITPPAQLPPGPVTIKAKLNWQMCNPSTCVPANADLTLALDSGNPQPANAELFAKWRAQLPRTEAPPFKVQWEIGQEQLALHVAGPPKDAKLEFFSAAA